MASCYTIHFAIIEKIASPNCEKAQNVGIHVWIMENPSTAKEPKLKGSNILPHSFIGLTYQGQDIVFRFIEGV
jgi:hypothetical protein